MEKNKKVKVKTTTWTIEYNPLYSVECPHCKNIIIMGKISMIDKLVAWKNQFKNK